MIVEGENLQAIITLYKYRRQVDLILTDICRTTLATTSVTTTDGKNIQTTRIWGPWYLLKMAHGIRNGCVLCFHACN